MFEAHVEPCEGAAGGTRLPLAAGRQATVEIRPQAVGLRVAVAQEPEGFRHTCEPIA
jgi:hypothetical protein